VQIRPRGFDLARLTTGRRVRDIYAAGSPSAERLRRLTDDACVQRLAEAVTGKLGGRVGVVPRLFLKQTPTGARPSPAAYRRAASVTRA
jgi:hypothetical protein